MERMILKITISGVKTLCATAKVLLRENIEGNFTATGDNQKYRYNGKELYGGLGWYDYGARYYDPVVGRFTGVDPLAEMMPSYSPYAYTFNNPMIHTDPTGMAPKRRTVFDLHAEQTGQEDISEGMAFKNRSEGASSSSDGTNSGSGSSSGSGNSSGDGGGNPIMQNIQSFYNNILDELGFDNDDRPSMEDVGALIDKKGEQLGTIIDYMELIPGVAIINYNNSTSEQLLAGGFLFFPIGKGAKPATGFVGEIVVQSLVKQNNSLLKLARKTFEGNTLLRDEANALIKQMLKGNPSPGIGNKQIFKGVFEARSENGARIYFRTSANGFDILGYSNKETQTKVINILKKIY